MNGVSPLLAISVMVTVFCLLAAVPLAMHLRSSEATKRLLHITQSPLKLEAAADAAGTRAKRAFVATAHFVRTRLGLEQNETLKQKLIGAGLRDSRAVDVYFGIRLMAPVLAVLLGTFIHPNTLFWIVALMGVAYLAPDMWLSRLTRQRHERIRLGLPDALDLMVVCVDAGLGVDQALLRAGQELAISQPEIAEEFLQINFEQRAGKPRIEAWESMAERTQVETVRSFVHMLAQTDRFGTPLVRALRVFAEGVRQKRRQEAEEMAAKTTVKLIFPLVLFIFPSIFIVLLGPAVILITRNLQGIFQ